MSGSVEANIIDSAMRTPKSPAAVYELPCGYLEETDKGPVLHNEVELKEMTGEEEDLLASRNIPFDKKMDALIASCLVRLGTIHQKPKIRKIVPQLLLGDRTFLFFAIRRASLGDEFPFREECPQCEETSLQPFDLGLLKLRKMPEPLKRSYHATLPSGAEVVFKCLAGEDEKRRDKYRKTLKPLSLQIFLRLESINGEEPTPLSIRGLTVRDRDFLRSQFASVDGGVETTIELTCPLCGTDFERELDPGQPSFFSPSETSEIWKRRSNI